VETHRRAHEDQARWQGLSVGQEITVIKLDPQGNEAARYPAVVLAYAPEDDWLALKAAWTYKRIELDGLVFTPGDELIEWFSPHLPFNAFAVLSPPGELRGWYANVTYPAYLMVACDEEPTLTLVWHDLYLDLVALPDETYVVRDEDELADSGLESADPPLHAEIVAAAQELVRRFTTRDHPFRLPGATGHQPSGSPAVPE
jgi:uncharacterized protein DUF402